MQVKWLEPSQSPFGVPVLDLTPVTQGMMSTSKDPAQAARAISWGSSVGEELDSASLADREEVACSLRYPAHAILPDGLLFVPSAMEEKWVLALRGEELLAARSWTGEVVVVARLRREGSEVHIEGLRMTEMSGMGILGDAVQTFDWLVRTHALGQLVPLPVNGAGAEQLESQPLVAFSLFGSKAVCAARSWDPPPPGVPLRTEGRVLRAVHGGNQDDVRALAARGESLDVPAPTLGLTPLCVAVIRRDLPMVKLLLELGADPDLGDDNGLFPLGQAIVHRASVEVMAAIVEAGARIDAVNEDRFGVLHAAAELDRGELVPWLVEHGAALEARTRHGHTPLHVACALGHLSAARALLAAGADPDATAPDGTTREIAAKQGHPEAVALLDSHHAQRGRA